MNPELYISRRLTFKCEVHANYELARKNNMIVEVHNKSENEALDELMFKILFGAWIKLDRHYQALYMALQLTSSASTSTIAGSKAVAFA